MTAPLRTFKAQHGLISTFEENPTHDPVGVVPVETTNKKYAVLYPALIIFPLQRNPIPPECRGEEPVRGFPIRWPIQIYPWCPYLPAVVSYHYRIFTGMVAPTAGPVHMGSSYGLDTETIRRWDAVEWVMQDIVRHTQRNVKHMDPNFRPPVYPSDYGYRKRHPRRRPALEAIKNSLHAFHQLLAYCSYIVATVGPSSFPSSSSVFFNDATKARDLPEAPEDHHTLTMLLWSSLGEIHRTRNFVGVIINPLEFWDHEPLYNMQRYGVPIYVLWSNLSQMQGYISHNKDGALIPWCPPASAFTANSPPTTVDERATPDCPPSPTHLPLNQRSQEYPWEYVKERKNEIGKLTLSPSQVARQKYAELFRAPGTKGAAVYEFRLCQKTDQNSGKEINEWKRVLLTRGEASAAWEDFQPSQLWFDCAKNQWNYCQEFKFEEHVVPCCDESESDGEIGWYRTRAAVPSLQHINVEAIPVQHSRIEQIEAGHSVAEEIHVEEPAVQQMDVEQIEVKHLMAEETHVEDPAIEQMDAERCRVEQVDVGGSLGKLNVLVGHPAVKEVHIVCSADEQADVEHDTIDWMDVESSPVAQVDDMPRSDQYLVNLWKDAEEFLCKRFGLTEISHEEDKVQDELLSVSLGLKRKVPDVSMVQLYTSVLHDNRWPDCICDLSPDRLVDNGDFPTRSPNPALNVIAFGKRYLLSVGHGQWKLLVEDPLTLLQIEREEWDMDPDSLVKNLVGKGLPFQVLNTGVQQGVPFHDHSVSEARPATRAPTQADYVAYRRGLSNFFLDYPHAYAAALCAGGILWRIAMDALPPPEEQNIVWNFHRRVCSPCTISGETYWTPHLTSSEERLIVGVYRWTETSSVSPRDDSWWPKPQMWAGSGLDFGAWAPLDEAWYQNRCAELNMTNAGCIRSNKWKCSIKYNAKRSKEFLRCARSLARSFLDDHRLTD